jgi:serine/threonine protein kinase
MAPEVASMKEHSQAADVWSLGIVLCVMLTGHIPFVSSRGVEQTIKNICTQNLNYQGKVWEGLPTSVINLIQLMLIRDPS